MRRSWCWTRFSIRRRRTSGSRSRTHKPLGSPVPLLDHFHPPIQGPWHWESFLCAWTVTVSGRLNEPSVLPADHFAEPEIEYPLLYETRVHQIGDANEFRA